MEDVTLKDETEKIFSPEIDKGNLYGIILIVVSICTLYITILTQQIWISFFIVIPLLYISRKEEEDQVKKNLKRRFLNEFSKIANFLFILTIIVGIIALFFSIGFIATVIILLISFKFYSYFSGVIIRKRYEKHNKVKIEAF